MQDSIVCSICKKDKTIITDLDRGEIVCSKCGLVISDKIQDSRQEWRDFGISEAKVRRRTGMPISLARYDMGLYTMIGSGYKDARGQVLVALTRSTMRRLRKWDHRTQVDTNRNLSAALSQLDKFCRYPRLCSFRLVRPLHQRHQLHLTRHFRLLQPPPLTGMFSNAPLLTHFKRVHLRNIILVSSWQIL
jgi:hypothetical protein